MPAVCFSVVLPLFLFLVMHGSAGSALIVICCMRQPNTPPLQHWPYHKFPSSDPLDLFRHLRLAVFLLPLCSSSNTRSDGRHPLSPWVFWEGAHGRRCMADIVPCHSFKTLVSRILSRLDTINCLTRLTWPANRRLPRLPSPLMSFLLHLPICTLAAPDNAMLTGQSHIYLPTTIFANYNMNFAPFDVPPLDPLSMPYGYGAE